MVGECLPVLLSLIYHDTHTDAKVLEDACWALAYISGYDAREHVTVRNGIAFSRKQLTLFFASLCAVDART